MQCHIVYSFKKIKIKWGTNVQESILKMWDLTSSFRPGNSSSCLKKGAETE